jgi:cytochrome c oxidase cbb3-type subunit IV
MEAYSTLASVFTVLSFLVFAGIVFWAYSARRKGSFDEAANEPFALPDEVDLRDGGARRTGPHAALAVAPSHATLTANPSLAGRAEPGAHLRREASDGAQP